MKLDNASLQAVHTGESYSAAYEVLRKDHAKRHHASGDMDRGPELGVEKERCMSIEEALAKVRAKRLGARPFAAKNNPHILVKPTSALISNHVESSIMVRFNVSRPGIFRAALLVHTNISGSKPIVLPINAVAVTTSIALSNSDPLEFGTVPMRTSKEIWRKLTNTGKMIPVNFKIQTENDSIWITPNSGRLNSGESIEICFTYRPTSSSMQKFPVVIFTSTSDPIIIQVSAFCGSEDLSIPQTLDFGRCSVTQCIAQDIVLENRGSASAQLLDLDVQEVGGVSDGSIFRKGKKWPKGGLVKPGGKIVLPVMFQPPQTGAFSGVLTLKTASGKRNASDMN